MVREFNKKKPQVISKVFIFDTNTLSVVFAFSWCLFPLCVVYTEKTALLAMFTDPMSTVIIYAMIHIGVNVTLE